MGWVAQVESKEQIRNARTHFYPGNLKEKAHIREGSMNINDVDYEDSDRTKLAHTYHWRALVNTLFYLRFP
jgi:hypothetical protein